MRGLQIALTIALLAPSQAVDAGTLIGHWCEETSADGTGLNYLITLTQEDEETIVALRSFIDGNHFRQTLKRGADGMLLDPEAFMDPEFRLRPDGALEQHDTAGLLKTLPPLENGIDPTMCFDEASK